MMVHSPRPIFKSTLPVRRDVLEAHNLLEQVRYVCSPDSTFDKSAVFCTELYSAFVCGKSSEKAPAAEGDSGSESGSGSAIPSEGGQDSQHGEESQRQQPSGSSRGGGGRRSESRHPLYKGVRKRGDRWVSEIREQGKKSRIWLGTFPTPEMAARAYDVGAFNLKRPYAYVNFPEAVSSLPVPQSLSPKHIQEAASLAAAAFRGHLSGTQAGRPGGLVPTSEVGETSNVASTSSAMPEQQQLVPQSTSPEQLLHHQSANPETIAQSFVDEDLIFDMPNVLTDMAAGLMIAPPLLHHGTNGDNNINNNNDGAETSLWDL